MRNEEHVQTKALENKSDKPFANAALVFGSPLPNYWQSLFRQRKFSEMVRLTSQKCLMLYGEQKVFAYYKNDLKFGYKLGRLSNISYEGDTIVLSYANAYQFGSKKLVTILCCLEHDTVKIILPNLKHNPFE